MELAGPFGHSPRKKWNDKELSLQGNEMDSPIVY